MSDLLAESAGVSGEHDRCPHCDSVIESGSDQCLMCGHLLNEIAQNSSIEPDQAPVSPMETQDVVEFVLRERETPFTFWLTAVFAVIIIVLGALVLRFQSSDITMALVPTPSPIPPTPTFTPQWTPLPVDTPLPTSVPTETAVPSATPTLQPPRAHAVVSGETLIGLSLRYRINIESIAAANSMASDASLFTDQQLLIPWPTPTPPLVSVATLINGETVIADPTGCERYEVQSGDSLSAIAGRYDVHFGLFLQVNRLVEESIPQPGDTVCIPEIVYGGSLPPTPGPSPTPTVTSVPAGPHLLFPVANAELEIPEEIVTFQWAAVKTLDEAEWYMVELTDLDEVDGLPMRGFTRDTAFQAPSSWRPPIDETHTLRWRVSIVQVTDHRADGLPIYTYGGESSQDAFFSWLGAVPTPTPTPSPTSTPEA